MIEYKNFTLDNGLKVFVHEDRNSPIAVVNILYNVGSRDEDPNKTGFAHLFEHLMFGGSRHIGNFDEPLQKVGGENNAFTSPDITNYYITLPKENIETAFWLESDRMLSLSFDPKVLEVQQNVVVEEFKQRYLNQPYGDAWLHLRALAYQVHPYQWPTIGKKIEHIEQATMEDVKSFFYKYYLPNNAILVVGGDVRLEEVKDLSEKWFGPIPAGEPYMRSLPAEPFQKETRHMEVSAKVPLDALYKVYHAPGKISKEYYTGELLSDILGRGKSSRLYERLVKQKKIFNSIGAHLTDSIDPGLFAIEGKLNIGIPIEEGEKAIQELLDEIMQNKVSEEEVSKVKNQSESTLVFGEMELLNRVMNLAFAANLGNPDLINQEAAHIQAVTSEQIQSLAKNIFRKENCSTLHYKSEK